MLDVSRVIEFLGYQPWGIKRLLENWKGLFGWRKEGCLGARQYSGWYHGDVMALEEQARGVVLHWKMHNVSGERGGSRVSSSSTIRDGGLRLYRTRSLFQVLAGGGGLAGRPI